MRTEDSVTVKLSVSRQPVSVLMSGRPEGKVTETNDTKVYVDDQRERRPGFHGDIGIGENRGPGSCQGSW